MSSNQLRNSYNLRLACSPLNNWAPYSHIESMRVFQQKHPTNHMHSDHRSILYSQLFRLFFLSFNFHINDFYLLKKYYYYSWILLTLFSLELRNSTRTISWTRRLEWNVLLVWTAKKTNAKYQLNNTDFFENVLCCSFSCKQYCERLFFLGI